MNKKEKKQYRRNLQIPYCRCQTHSYKNPIRIELMTQEKNAKPYYFIAKPYEYNVYLCEVCGKEYTDLPVMA